MYMGSVIHGIGTDIVEIERIRNSINQYGNQFIHRIFTRKEQEYCSGKPVHLQAVHYAARFAAKEAFAKALGTGIGTVVEFKHIGIHNSDSGKPIIEIETNEGVLLSEFQFHCSMSHTHIYAIATVIIEKVIQSTETER